MQPWPTLADGAPATPLGARGLAPIWEPHALGRQPVMTTDTPVTLAAARFEAEKSGDAAPVASSVPVTSASAALAAPVSVTLNAMPAQPAALVTGAVVTL